MKRCLVLVFLFSLVLPANSAAPARHPPARRPSVHHSLVEVRRDWPLRRALHEVVAHAPREAVRVAVRTYLPPVPWDPAVVTRPAGPVLIWADRDRLTRDEGWVEFTLNSHTAGRSLFLEAIGRIQVDWAEVVFENGEARVLDFHERTYGPGFFKLLDLPRGRVVDHVRMVARAVGPDANVVLRIGR